MKKKSLKIQILAHFMNIKSNCCISRGSFKDKDNQFKIQVVENKQF